MSECPQVASTWVKTSQVDTPAFLIFWLNCIPCFTFIFHLSYHYHIWCVAGCKCLMIFHEILSHAPSNSLFSVYIINNLHHMTASEVLLDSISITMATMQSQRDDSKLYELFLSRLKLTFEVIILLLKQTKKEGTDTTPLQQLLASHFTIKTTSQSITQHIVSLIHCSCDPQLPCVATKMLKQLCEVCVSGLGQ